MVAQQIKKIINCFFLRFFLPLISSLTCKFRSFWSDNELRKRSKLAKIAFFASSKLLSPILSYFPIPNERMKLQLKILTLNGRSGDEKRINSFLHDFFTFIFQFVASPDNHVLFEKDGWRMLKKKFRII